MAVADELYDMCHHRLFDEPRWLTDTEAYAGVSRKLLELGLQEVRDDEQLGILIRTTGLGKEHDLELALVWLGVWDLEDMVLVLIDRGLLDDGVWFRLPSFQSYHNAANDDDTEGLKLERILRRIVQRAWRAHHAGPNVIVLARPGHQP